MATIFDVAKSAEVSIATVSRVLSRRDPVSDEVRERVMRAVEQLGYEPNRAARSLRTSRSTKILLTVPNISNPFFGNLIRGAEEEARAQGYSVILNDMRHDATLESLCAVMLRQREVDGSVYVGRRLPDTLKKLISERRSPTPIVSCCEHDPDLGISSVDIDNAAAAADATEHLVSLGHQRIGVITGPPGNLSSGNRLAGVRKVIAQHGLNEPLRVRVGKYTLESGYEEARRLLEESSLTAIFCFSDEMAIGALKAIRDAGLSCPEDVSVVGFDDIRFASFSSPPLTTIAQPSAEIGKRSVQILLKIIMGRRSRITKVTLPHELIVRQSTTKARPR